MEQSELQNADEAQVAESTERVDNAELMESAELVEASERSLGEEQSETERSAAEEDSGTDEYAGSSFESEAEADSRADLMFVEVDRIVSIVESVLFASDRPVSLASLKSIFEGTTVRSKDIIRAIETLASVYAGATRGVTLEEVTGGYQLRTKVDNADFLKRNHKVRPFRLSGPALEVISIIAYRQPITKPEIDQIRGVESGHLVRALMERGLVHFGEKSDLPGRPMQYLTSRKFLEIFGLRNLQELPSLAEIDQLLPEGIGDEEDKETLSDLTEALSQEVAGQYSVAEDELTDISETIKVIDSTSEFFEQEKKRAKEQRDRERAQDIRERLTVGELVDDKDVRWLDRFEKGLAQQAAEQFAKEAAAAVQSISTELNELSIELSDESSATAVGVKLSEDQELNERSEVSVSSDSDDDDVEFEAEGSL